MPGLFNKKVLHNRIKNYSIDNLEEKIDKIKSWQQSLSKIKGLNEKRLQSAFLKALFEDILGYENTPQKDEWTLDIEATTDIDAKHPDGILGFFERVENEEIRGHEAVIELKGPQVSLDRDQKRQGTTYKSPVDQAFSYTNKLDKCKWVIVSNFMEIRLYKVGRSKEYFEFFLLDDLDDIEEFKKFYYLLNKDHLISKTGKSVTLELSEKTVKKEEDISVEFYNLYKNVRVNLFEHLKENNLEKESELLLEKAQKFLDRIIFIGFCEDKDLLPNDLLHEAIERGKNSFSPSQTAVWNQIRGVFHSIDQGNENHNINAYNGGLFEYDEDLDGLIIENDFFDVIYEISDYDFDSDVDVNILGHIFEQSITDIEKLKSDIREDEFDKNESKRKKDGIYYTPQYITSYIIENAIGGYLEDRKEELGYYDLPNIEEAGSDSWETRYTNQHLKFYNEYEEVLKNIKVLDPACGSGAFLNQAFDYLLEEHRWLNKQRDLLKGGQSSIFALDAVQRDILKNNIFGVDLNEESVEITKLSLWLKTANKRKPLTNLDDNIKCGNSLIDDPVVAGDKAFKWEEEFKEIMAAGGFDVVVGNPPYVEHKKLKNISSNLKNYKTYSGTADLYVYFFEKGLNVLKRKGNLSFITSNKFIKTRYGKPLRNLLVCYKINELIDFSKVKVFDALVASCIVSISNKKVKTNNIRVSFVDDSIKSYSSLEQYISENNFMLDQKSLSAKIWQLKDEIKLLLKSKIERDTKKLQNLSDISRGITTGYNPAFIIDEDTKKELINKDKSNKKVIKPLLQGRNIKKWIYYDTNEYLIFIPWHFPLHKDEDIKDASEKAEKAFRENYPYLYKYLQKYQDHLSSRNQEETGIRYEWYALQRYASSYYKNFEKEKLIWGLTADKWAFAYDDKQHYLPSNGYILTSNEISIKYLLGILNSKLMKFYFGFIGIMTAGGAFTLKNETVSNFPIKIKNSENIIRAVNTLIDMKKKLSSKNEFVFQNILYKYSSLESNNVTINNILHSSDFNNNIYSGRASKIRNYTVNINTNIVTIYLDKSSSGKYEVLKFEENNRYKRQYLKYYLENLTDEQLSEIDDKYSGNILKKTLEIEIPDYNKEHVVKKVVQEWENLQQEIKDLENEIDKIDRGIDRMIYNLYGLTDEEIQIVEENVN